MRLLEKLILKRDAAHAEYLKWSGMIETLQSDPDFTSIAHYGATKVMKEAHALANGNGNGNGHDPDALVFAARAEAARKGWSDKRRREYSERMKANPIQGGRKPKKVRVNRLTPAERKASADRLRKRLADPKFAAKRLKALRKALKAKKAARKNGTPWVAKNADRIAQVKAQAQAGA